MFLGAVLLAGACIASSCQPVDILNESIINPFTDLPPVEIDGNTRALQRDIVPLGELNEDRVIRIRVDAQAMNQVLILIADTQTDEAGIIVGGGPANETFHYRIPKAGRYFVFTPFEPTTPASERTGQITLDDGPASFRPPSRQIVRVEFADGFLSNPGLLDPTSQNDVEQQLLRDLEPTIEAQIIAVLTRRFANTPIKIVTTHEPTPTEPFSRLRYLPDRITTIDPLAIDFSLPAPDPDRPECQISAVFGEVLPAGVQVDPGNARRDDEAVIYVGSFQGRGETCRTAVINSVNNIALSLAQAGAHEIGHLVGLYHVEQVDLMNRSATLAFYRELPFQRGQVQFDRMIDGRLVTEVLTSIVQDPEIYFAANFGSSD